MAATTPLPTLPKPITRDIATLNLDDAVLGHHKLWESYGHEVTAFAVNLLVALLILVITFWAAGWGAGLAKRAIGRMHSKTGAADVTLQSFLGSLTRYLIIVVGVVAVLQTLGVKTTSVLAVLSGLLLGVGLALQGTLSNVAAGVMLLLFRPYRVGDLVEVGGRMGTVKALDLMVTELTTQDNLKVTAPNGKIFGEFIVNYSKPAKRRVDVTFHIPPTRDLAAVLEAMKALLADDKRIAKEPPPSFEANALNELYAEGIIRVWVKSSDYVPVKTMIVLAVQKLALAPPPPAPIQPPA
jgi:small conductance mechanosensitive channel